MSDKEGYPVMLDDKCFFVYATPQGPNGTLVPSNKRVGDVDPEKEGFEKGIPANATICTGMCNGHDDESGNRLLASTNRKLVHTKRKNLVILLRFSDHIHRQLPSPADINILFNAPGGHPWLAPSGSIRDVYLKNSYGLLDLESEAYGWVTLPHSEAYYADGKSALSDKFLEAVRDALDLVQSQGSLDFRSFDGDSDGYIDTLTLLHSGYAAEWGGTDAYGASMYDRIWSHKWGLTWISNSGIRVNKYVAVPSLWGTGGSTIGRIGVIAHELGHYLGLPDLYGGTGGTGIGSYGMMANSWGFDGSQYYPPMLSPWSKIRLAWLDAKKITTSGQYSIQPSATVQDVYRIDIGGSPSEYLLIENRQALDFDEKLPQGGLCIWHIDENAGHRDAGFPGDQGWPSNGNHYRVSLLQADGDYDLERGINRGDAGDVFHAAGVDAIGPSNPDGTGPFPNSDAYQGGIVTRSGVTIFDISPSGAQMQFSVKLPGAPGPSPTPPNPLQLRTTFEGGNGAAGNMFDVLPRTDIILFGMDIHTSAEERVVVEVWTKEGTHIGFETNVAAWVRLLSSEIKGLGRGKASYLAIDPLRLPATKKRAFYVTVVVGTGLRYTNGNGVGSVYTSNSDLVVIEGVGKTHPFGKTYPSRMWNGVLHYYLVEPTNAPTPAPTPAPTLPPPSDSSLETTYIGGTEQAGNMFDILAFEDIVVTGFDIHCTSKAQLTVEIYTKAETYVGNENQCSKWTLISTVTTVGRGAGTPTPLPANSFDPVSIGQFRVQAFYITIKTSDGKGMRYTRGTGRGTVIAADNSLAVLEGVGSSYACGRFFVDRIWNGVVHYDRRHQSLTLPPTGPHTTSLQTTFVGGKQAAGNMFVVTALKSLSIVEMSVHVDGVGDATLEIFTKPDIYDGFESNPGAWVPIMSRTITRNGRGEASHVPIGSFDPIFIAGGDRVAFYVTITTGDMRYTDGARWGSKAASNDDMVVSKGIGVAYRYGKIYQNRVWNGVLTYELK
jgi:M6 family metalloprotease-like protein